MWSPPPRYAIAIPNTFNSNRTPINTTSINEGANGFATAIDITHRDMIVTRIASIYCDGIKISTTITHTNGFMTQSTIFNHNGSLWDEDPLHFPPLQYDCIPHHFPWSQFDCVHHHFPQT